MERRGRKEREGKGRGGMNRYIRWLSKEPMQDGIYTWRRSFNCTTQMFTTLNNYMEVKRKEQ